ncbi:MAG: hypothetical protein JW760_10555 [Spirochaetales bacterium]|nr:hypothetical protein [Spirochaetales bacterium]
MTRRNSLGKPDPKALEVCGFLSYGILHRYTNSVNRIRLQAEFSAEGTPEEMRSSLQEIIREVDRRWNTGLLKIFFTPDVPETRVFFDTNSLEELGDILTYSCRCFLISLRWICDSGVAFSCTLRELKEYLIRPVMDYCGIVSFKVSKMPDYSLELSKEAAGGLRIEHRCSPSKALMDDSEKQSRLFAEENSPWRLYSAGTEDFYSARFFLAAPPGGFNDPEQSADIGERQK